MTGWPVGDQVPMRYGRIIADPPWYFANYSAAGEEKNPVAHYACMDLDAIKALPVGHLAAPDCALLMWATFPMLPQALETMRAWGFTYKTGGAWGKLSKTGAKVAFGTGYVLRSAAELFLIGTIGKPKIRSASVRNLIMTAAEPGRDDDDLSIAHLGDTLALLVEAIDLGRRDGMAGQHLDAMCSARDDLVACRQRLYGTNLDDLPELVAPFFTAPVGVHSEKPPHAHQIMTDLFDGPGCELFARATVEGWAGWGNELGKLDGGAA